MSRLIIAILSFFIVVNSFSQEHKYCKNTSVFFGSNVDTLNGKAIESLENYLKNLNEKGVLIELVGHCDTFGRASYNDSLSGRRLQSVKNFIASRYTGEYGYKRISKGESYEAPFGSVAENNAYNRRVDISSIVVRDDRVVVDGTYGTSAEIPVSIFDSCEICKANIEVVGYVNEKEANAEGILLKTIDGLKLETAGMIDVSFNCCSASMVDRGPIYLNLPSKSIDSCMKLWEAVESNGSIVWKPSPNTLLKGKVPGTYSLVSTTKGLDKVCTDNSSIRLLGGVNKLFSLEPTGNDQILVETPMDLIKKNTLVYRDTAKTQFKNADTFSVSISNRIRSIIFINRKFRILDDTLTAFGVERVGGCGNTFFIRIDTSDYKVLGVEEKLVKTKASKSLEISRMGYYLTDYGYFVPFDKVDEKNSTGYFPKEKYQIAYMKNGVTYTTANDKIVKKGKEYDKIKMKKKYMAMFAPIKRAKSTNP